MTLQTGKVAEALMADILTLSAVSEDALMFSRN